MSKLEKYIHIILDDYIIVMKKTTTQSHLNCNVFKTLFSSKGV